MDEAEPLYREAKAGLEKTVGKEHPNYPRTLNNLAMLLDDMGNLEEAIKLNKESLAIEGKVLGTDHPLYATSLNNLAALLSAQVSLYIRIYCH